MSKREDGTDRIVAAIEASTAAIVAAIRAQNSPVHIHTTPPPVPVRVGDVWPLGGGQLISTIDTRPPIFPGNTITIKAAAN